ncbi:hypothetical protein BN13_2100001 [Nostocoides jenkinsii Ben 74]|uniref:Uncharacterized protein n=1 Tax=Nostocoides jenkinsii Ben 74 TaxID=1193518 RepID=A0A077MDE4_9MICO|nr:hypothetical protein BN13_2100001 [Tetrasphaera jenkinsii Ben 74]
MRMMFPYQGIRPEPQSAFDCGLHRFHQRILIYLLSMLESTPKHVKPKQTLRRYVTYSTLGMNQRRERSFG